MYSDDAPIQPRELMHKSVEDVYARLIRRGNGGTTVRTGAAPALSTQFVKSMAATKATALQPGALAEISFPALREMEANHSRQHEDRVEMGYHHTLGSSSNPAGFGERSARALAREESTYQLKGIFSSAVLSFTKLRARVEARGGDMGALERIFAKLWGLSELAVNSLPRLHIDGSEATRMSAMEDRAYHSLSGHPGHTGGFRIDIATLAPDALGSNIPINWPRIRTSLKAIAEYQIQGDATISAGIKRIQTLQRFAYTMDIVMGSQPVYARPFAWETLIDTLMRSSELKGLARGVGTCLEPAQMGLTYATSYMDTRYKTILDNEEMAIEDNVQKIASIVTTRSNQALERTVAVMMEFDRERATHEDVMHEDYSELEASKFASNFEVPRYKLTRDSLYKGMSRQNIGADKLPDIKSHGKSPLSLDLREFREAHLGIPINIQGALNMAVYLTVLNPTVKATAYELMHLVKDPRDDPASKAAIRLRRSELYSDSTIRALGDRLFGDVFMNVFGLLVRNLSTQEYKDEVSIKNGIWQYFSKRSDGSKVCPIAGGWRDLMVELRTLPEGWTLYYWVRVTIGKSHHSLSTGILAPIAAGESVDFLTLMKKSIKVRAQSWSSMYAAKYKVIEGKISAEHAKKKKKLEEVSKPDDGPAKYIPPHIKHMIALEKNFNADEILNRSQEYTVVQYRQMVEMQSKSKFFSKISVYTYENKLVVGITDEEMHTMLVDFYMSRWLSLDVRIKKAKKVGKVFRLGPHPFPEHPWGELEHDLPMSCTGMLTYMQNLDKRAWTLEPTYLQDKLQKSIREMWEDVGSEIQQIVEFVNEVYDGRVEEQEDLVAKSTTKNPMAALTSVEPIPLPSFGYTPPYTMPEKMMTTSKGKVPMNPDAFTDPTVVPEEELPTEEELPMGEELDSALTFFSGETYDAVITAAPVSYLNYRTIWHLLNLPESSDSEMRFAYGMDATTDLSGQHVLSELGPVILSGDEDQVPRKWARKKLFMQKRLGMNVMVEEVEDLQ